MSTRVQLGDVVYVETLVKRDGEGKNGRASLHIKEISIDLKANSPERVLAEAGDIEKTKIARMASQYLAVERYSSLYLAGPISGFPVKVGFADDPLIRLNSLQCGNHEELVFHAVFWTTLGGAYAIEQRVLRQAKKSGLHERGEWIAATPVTAVDMIIEAAQVEGVDLFTSAMAIENRGRMMKALDEAEAFG